MKELTAFKLNAREERGLKGAIINPFVFMIIIQY